MTSMIKLRTIFYSLVIAVGVSQTIIAVFCGILDGFSHLRLILGRVATGLSIPTWVLASVLLAYNNRPSATNIFTKKTLHLVSFAIFTVVWLAIGIAILTQAPAECNFETYSDGLAGIWCGFTAGTGAVGLLLSILSGITVAFIHKSEPDAQGNIAGSSSKVEND